MATTKAVDLINRVANTLLDPTFVRWTQQELLNYLNEAQRQIVTIRADANAVTSAFTCAASAKQSLPANGSRLINVIRNTNGRAITMVDKKLLDEQLPSWYETEVGTDGVKHFIYDISDPKNFYLFPKPTAANQVDIVYSAIPADIVISNFTTDVQTITLDDLYAAPIMDYMVFRAYMKDSEYGNTNRATAFYQAFAQAIGTKTQGDAGLFQNMNANKPGSPRQ